MKREDMHDSSHTGEILASDGSMPRIGVESQLYRQSRMRTTGNSAPALGGAPEEALIEPMTARELMVLSLICDGSSNDEIAQRLDIGLAAVKWHINQIFGKLGVSRRIQAVAIAVHLRLVEPVWLPRAASPKSPPPSALSNRRE